MKHLFMLLLPAIFFAACNPQNSNKAYDALPELPENILAQLDTNKMATAMQDEIVLPVRDTTSGVAMAPCCGIKIERSLQVTMPYTKCGPLLDFIAVDVDNLVVAERRSDSTSFEGNPMPGSNATMHKLTRSRNSKYLQTICVTSNGPWNATLTESRACSNYSPHYSLVVAPEGDLVLKQWTGGIENHPANIGLVSCKYLSTLETPCGGLSSCDCRSSICKAPDPCNCGIESNW